MSSTSVSTRVPIVQPMRVAMACPAVSIGKAIRSTVDSIVAAGRSTDAWIVAAHRLIGELTAVARPTLAKRSTTPELSSWLLRYGTFKAA